MDSEHNWVNNDMEGIPQIINEELEIRRLDLEIKDLEEEYIIEIKLIGFDKDEILIFIEDEKLFVEAKREDILDEENDEYMIQEHNYAYCQRSFSLQGIDKKGVNAYYENNFVFIHLPKI
ncbi:Hsp20 family protein [Alkalibaculum sp. M08DMB]|uniref:Hsp20 family protein n=1 Tax=Alkalibaculum sporogenes TaxID=2655001 RepID=A0A6A7KBH6_9FIRM|nr:Hsp20 family protein [Alkalibaculum sporogenes]MPW26910.1 Hsp20 family protein [Alkalibaculum sporogenes]